LFGAASREIKRTRQAGGVSDRIAVDEGLFDARQRAPRGRAAGIGIERRHAPAGEHESHLGQRRAQGVARLLGVVVVVRQEHESRDGPPPGVDARLGGQRTQERTRAFQQQPAPIAAATVGGDAAAMGHARQRLQRLVDQRPRGAVVELRDQPKPTTVPFVAGVVQAVAAAIAVHPVSGAGLALVTAARGSLARSGLPSQRMVRLKHSLCSAASLRLPPLKKGRRLRRRRRGDLLLAMQRGIDDGRMQGRSARLRDQVGNLHRVLQHRANRKSPAERVALVCRLLQRGRSYNPRLATRPSP